MAEKKRNLAAKIVTFVLFGLLIASFAVWGIGDIFRNPSQTSSVAEVGGVPIYQQDFTRQLSREVNRLSARFGGQLDMEQARALGIPDQVLSQMIGRALFDRKAADMGLIVTDEQIRRRVHQERAFQNDLGEFDRLRFEETMRNSGLSESEYLNTLRRDILRQQIANTVTEEVPAPRQLADALYRYREERRIAQVLVVPNDSIQDLPEPDNAALEAFHKEFADRFMAPEYRTVNLVQLRAEDIADESVVSESELRAEYDSRRADFITPERRSLSQFVLSDEAAAQQAESRLKEGFDFAALAKELTGEDPIDLGTLEKIDLPKEIGDAAFDLDPGNVSAAVKSDLGWHILKVSKIEPQIEPSFEDVRDDLANDAAMRIAVDSMASIANQLDDELGGGASLEESANALNLQLRRIEAISRQGTDLAGDPVEDVPADRFIETVFDTAAGQDSLLIGTTTGDYFVLHVDSVSPANLRPLDEVKEEVMELWRNAQRANLAREKAEALAESAALGRDLPALAAESGYEITTTAPLTRFDTAADRSPSPGLAGKLFQIKLGEITSVTAPSGHVVAKLTEIQAADPASNAEALASVQDNLAASLQGDVLEQFIAMLRGEYGVTVNERELENLLATF